MKFSDNLAIQSLPSPVTHLHAGDIALNVTVLPKLPQLKTFYAENMPIPPSILNQLACHSTQLEDLVIQTADVSMDGLTIIYGAYQSFDSKPDPRSLVRFNKLTSFYDSPEDPSTDHHQIYRFSKSLKRVSINLCDYVGDPFLTRVLPNSIQQLYLGNASFLTDLGIQALSSWTNLTEFTLLMCFKVTSASFKHLPRHLKQFETNTELIYDEHIVDLPRSLTSITINSAKNLTDACAPFLPPSMIELYVKGNKLLTQAIVEHIPSRARVESATFVTVSNEKQNAL